MSCIMMWIQYFEDNLYEDDFQIKFVVYIFHRKNEQVLFQRMAAFKLLDFKATVPAGHK